MAVSASAPLPAPNSVSNALLCASSPRSPLCAARRPQCLAPRRRAHSARLARAVAPRRHSASARTPHACVCIKKHEQQRGEGSAVQARQGHSRPAAAGAGPRARPQLLRGQLHLRDDRDRGLHPLGLLLLGRLRRCLAHRLCARPAPQNSRLGGRESRAASPAPRHRLCAALRSGAMAGGVRLWQRGTDGRGRAVGPGEDTCAPGEGATWQRRRRAVHGCGLREQALRAQQVAVQLAQADEQPQAPHAVRRRRGRARLQRCLRRRRRPVDRPEQTSSDAVFGRRRNPEAKRQRRAQQVGPLSMRRAPNHRAL